MNPPATAKAVNAFVGVSDLGEPDSKSLIIITSLFSKCSNVLGTNPPEPDGGSGAGKGAEVPRVAEIEYDVDQVGDGSEGEISEKPALDEVVGEFAGQPGGATQDNAKAHEATKRGEATAGFDGIEQITEGKENQADERNKDEWSQQRASHSLQERYNRTGQSVKSPDS